MGTYSSLSMEVLSWTASRLSSLVAEDSDWKTPYRYWKHAEHLLTYPNNEHFRIDCIGNLKRAIDHRLKRLASLYQFKKIPDPTKPSQLLDILGHFGIARPAMLREISKLRNLLEHQYESPPPQNRCLELVELAWYFLRSTDLLSTSVLEILFLRPDINDAEGDAWIEVTYGPKTNWKCSLRGQVPENFLGDGSNAGLPLVLKRCQTAKEITTTAIENASVPMPARRETDVYFIGEVSGKPEAFAALTSLYFSVL